MKGFEKLEIKIAGLSPLLMHSRKVMKLPKPTRGDYDNKAYCEAAAYWASTGKKQLIIPAENIKRSLLVACKFFKLPGTRTSAKSLIAAGLFVEPTEIPLGTAVYEMDLRYVRIQGKSAIERARPMVRDWSPSFTILYDKAMIGKNIIKEILDLAGSRVGVCDFRPEHGGSFGRFEVIKCG